MLRASTVSMGDVFTDLNTAEEARTWSPTKKETLVAIIRGFYLHSDKYLGGCNLGECHTGRAWGPVFDRSRSITLWTSRSPVYDAVSEQDQVRDLGSLSSGGQSWKERS